MHCIQKSGYRTELNPLILDSIARACKTDPEVRSNSELPITNIAVRDYYALLLNSVKNQKKSNHVERRYSEKLNLMDNLIHHDREIEKGNSEKWSRPRLSLSSWKFWSSGSTGLNSTSDTIPLRSDDHNSEEESSFGKASLHLLKGRTDLKRSPTDKLTRRSPSQLINLVTDNQSHNELDDGPYGFSRQGLDDSNTSKITYAFSTENDILAFNKPSSWIWRPFSPLENNGNASIYFASPVFEKMVMNE